MKKSNAYGMLITSMLIFGTVGIFRRFLPLTSGLIAFSRGIMGGLCLLLLRILNYKKGKSNVFFRDFGPSKLILLILAGGIIGLNWILLFEAYNRTSVATATLCYYMQPTLLVLLSPLFFGEKLTGKKLLCSGLACLGMVFVSGITESEVITFADISGILYGLSAAVFYTAAVILNKKTPTEDNLTKTAIELFSASAVLLPYLLLSDDFSLFRPDSRSVILLLVMGFIHTGLAYALYFVSITVLKGQTVALMSYIDPVTALLLSALLLQERLSLPALAGGILILGSTLLSELNPSKTHSV